MTADSEVGKDGCRGELLPAVVGQPASPAAPFQHGIPDCEQWLQAGGLGVPEGKTGTGGGNNYLPLGMCHLVHRSASPYHTSRRLPTPLFSAEWPNGGESCPETTKLSHVSLHWWSLRPKTSSNHDADPHPVHILQKWMWFSDGGKAKTALGIVGERRIAVEKRAPARPTRLHSCNVGVRVDESKL